MCSQRRFERSMKNIEIFEMGMDTYYEPDSPDYERDMVEQATVLNTLEFMGYFIRRYDLMSSPRAFIENGYVAQLLQSSGDEAFPVVIVDDELRTSGSLPSVEEWGEICGIESLRERLIPLTEEQVRLLHGESPCAVMAAAGDQPFGGCAGCTGCGGF